jgi:hypothetical protein
MGLSPVVLEDLSALVRCFAWLAKWGLDHQPTSKQCQRAWFGVKTMASRQWGFKLKQYFKQSRLPMPAKL